MISEIRDKSITQARTEARTEDENGLRGTIHQFRYSRYRSVQYIRERNATRRVNNAGLEMDAFGVRARLPLAGRWTLSLLCFVFLRMTPATRLDTVTSPRIITKTSGTLTRIR